MWRQDAALRRRAEVSQLGVLTPDEPVLGTQVGCAQPGAAALTPYITKGAQYSHGSSGQQLDLRQQRHSGSLPAKWGCGSFSAALRGVAVFKRAVDSAEEVSAAQQVLKEGGLHQRLPDAASSPLAPVTPAVSGSLPGAREQMQSGAAASASLPPPDGNGTARNHQPLNPMAPPSSTGAAAGAATRAVMDAEVPPEALETEEAAERGEAPVPSLRLSLAAAQLPPPPQQVPQPSLSFMLRSQGCPPPPSPPHVQQQGSAEGPLLVLSSQEDSDLQLRLQSPRAPRPSTSLAYPTSLPASPSLAAPACTSRGGSVKLLQDPPPGGRRMMALHRGPNGQVTFAA